MNGRSGRSKTKLDSQKSTTAAAVTRDDNDTNENQNDDDDNRSSSSATTTTPTKDRVPKLTSRDSRNDISPPCVTLTATSKSSPNNNISTSGSGSGNATTTAARGTVIVNSLVMKRCGWCPGLTLRLRNAVSNELTVCCSVLAATKIPQSGIYICTK